MIVTALTDTVAIVTGASSGIGDATARRPDPSAPDARQAFHDYVHVRDNPAGRHEELWYRANGCRSWIRAVRDTRTHAFEGATLAMEATR